MAKLIATLFYSIIVLLISLTGYLLCIITEHINNPSFIKGLLIGIFAGTMGYYLIKGSVKPKK